MECQWGHDDCKFLGDKCYLCSSDSFHYKPVKIKRKQTLNRIQQKQDGRAGSGFEYKNHKANEAALADSVVSRMTLNSGATVLEKGDEQIRGIINVMEELKTRTVEQAPGKKTFTIQKKWLDKLHFEAIKEHMEFWYLKFCFHENENDIYVIVEQDQIMSMIKTMKEDRLRAKQADKQIAVAQRMKEKVEAELALERSKNALLEAELALKKKEEI